MSSYGSEYTVAVMESLAWGGGKMSILYSVHRVLHFCNVEMMLSFLHANLQLVSFLYANLRLVGYLGYFTYLGCDCHLVGV